MDDGRFQDLRSQISKALRSYPYELNQRLQKAKGERMENEFAPGDVVVLRSHGPQMTVESIDTEHGITLIYCVWFEKDQARRMTLRPAALQKAPKVKYF
jgi:uncharacterized protein YodC (DUF2158 family)